MKQHLTYNVIFKIEYSNLTWSDQELSLKLSRNFSSKISFVVEMILKEHSQLNYSLNVHKIYFSMKSNKINWLNNKIVFPKCITAKLQTYKHKKILQYNPAKLFITLKLKKIIIRSGSPCNVNLSKLTKFIEWLTNSISKFLNFYQMFKQCVFCY